MNPNRSNAPTLQRVLKSLSLYLATIGGCALFVLLSIRLAPPAQALDDLGVSSSLYEAHTIPLSDEHAFAYWNSPIGTTAVLAKTLVLSFLDSHLK